MNYEGMSYDEIRATAKYSIVRSHRDIDGVWEKIVESGLTLDAARKRERELGRAERLAHPEKTGWTHDVRRGHNQAPFD
jgi:hypothetical protein